jgi:hypothetical protein
MSLPLAYVENGDKQVYEFKLYLANEAMQLEPKRPRFFLGGKRRVYLNVFGFLLFPLCSHQVFNSFD